MKNSKFLNSDKKGVTAETMEVKNISSCMEKDKELHSSPHIKYSGEPSIIAASDEQNILYKECEGSLYHEKK